MCMWIESLLVLMCSGLSVNDSLRAMADEACLSQQMLYFLDRGECLSNVMNYYSHFFPKSFIQIMKVMTKFTSIEVIIKFFLNFHKKTKHIMQESMRMLYMSCVSLLIAIGLLYGISILGHSVLQPILSEFNIKMPWIFRINKIYHLLIFVILAIVYKFRYSLSLLYHIKLESESFLLFSFLHEAMKDGIHIDDAIKISCAIVDTNIINIEAMSKAILNGEEFYKCCDIANLPTKQTTVLKIAEKSGDLVHGLKVSADISEVNMKSRIIKLTAIIKWCNIALSLGIIVCVFKFGLMSITNTLCQNILTM